MAGLFGKGGEVFLDEDDSKTLGNIDYMRTSKVTRRTFPKTATNKVGELIKQVSATEDRKVSDYKPKSFLTNQALENGNGSQTQTFNSFQPPVNKSTPKAEPTPEAPKAEPTPIVKKPASTSDDSMDMFLNMARQIKRR